MLASKDFWSGVLFLAIGLTAALVSRQYQFGTLRAMGPGFFPVVIGSLIALFGAFITLRAMFTRVGEGGRITPFAWRPLLLICLAIIVFGMLIQPIGFIGALLAMLVIARLAGREGSLLEFVVMTVVLIAVAWLIFSVGLRIPFNLVPRSWAF